MWANSLYFFTVIIHCHKLSDLIYQNSAWEMQWTQFLVMTSMFLHLATVCFQLVKLRNKSSQAYVFSNSAKMTLAIINKVCHRSYPKYDKIVKIQHQGTWFLHMYLMWYKRCSTNYFHVLPYGWNQVQFITCKR
jgi:hypothetical protein